MIRKLADVCVAPVAERVGKKVAGAVPEGPARRLVEAAVSETAVHVAAEVAEQVVKTALKVAIPGAGIVGAVKDTVHAVQVCADDRPGMEKTGALVNAGGSVATAAGPLWPVGAVVGPPVSLAGSVLERAGVLERAERRDRAQEEMASARRGDAQGQLAADSGVADILGREV